MTSRNSRVALALGNAKAVTSETRKMMDRAVREDPKLRPLALAVAHRLNLIDADIIRAARALKEE